MFGNLAIFALLAGLRVLLNGAADKSCAVISNVLASFSTDYFSGFLEIDFTMLPCVLLAFHSHFFDEVSVNLVSSVDSTIIGKSNGLINSKFILVGTKFDSVGSAEECSDKKNS